MIRSRSLEEQEVRAFVRHRGRDEEGWHEQDPFHDRGNDDEEFEEDEDGLDDEEEEEEDDDLGDEDEEEDFDDFEEEEDEDEEDSDF